MLIRKLFPILLIIFTNILGGGVILPILPLYAEGAFGGTILQITLLSTAYFAAQFLAAPWLGRLSDRIGRRPVLLISQLGTIVAFVLFIFAGPLGELLDAGLPWLPLTGGMVMLYAARILDGLTGGNITTAQAYVSDVTGEEERAHGLGLLQGAFGVGFIFGPAFGGVLANFGSTVPFIGAALITTITFLLTFFTLEESLPAHARDENQRAAQPALPLPALFGQRSIALLLGVTFFSTLAFSALPATFALYANDVLFAGSVPADRMQLAIGLMLALHGLLTVVTQVGLLQPLVKRLGEQRLLVFGDLALILAMLGVGLATSPALAAFSFAPFAFGQGVTQPSLQSLMTRFGGRGTGGRLLGLYQAARSLALIFGPVWSGYAFEQISPRSVYLGGSVIMLLATALAAALMRIEIPHRGVPPSDPDPKPFGLLSDEAVID
jgi:DHA1 family tetracycline resistance protein-like MFS transporter